MSLANLIIGLGQNIALLLAFTFAYGFIPPLLGGGHPITKIIFQGVVFGLFGVLAIFTSIRITEGFLLDGRIVIIAIAGLFGGGIPVLIASVIIALYRITIGGAGTLPALASLATTALMSHLLRPYLKRASFSQQWRWLLLLGIGVAVQSELWTALLGQSEGQEAFSMTLLPRLLLIPTGIVLLGLLMLYQERQAAMNKTLKESEDRYATLFNNSLMGLYRTSPAGDLLTYNPAVVRILGYPNAESLQTLNMADLYAVPEEWPRWRGWLEKYGMVNAFETELHGYGGKIVWVRNSARCIRDSAGRPLHYEGTLEDITEQKHAEKRLIQERDLLRTLIDTSPDYIFIKDAQGRFVVSNLAHDQAAHVYPKMLVGKTAFDVFPPDLAAQFHADDERIMQSGEPLINMERTTVGEHGEAKTVLTTKIPLRDKQGQVTGLVGISRDITDRKQLEARNTELMTERDHVKVLQRFITDMSHDFRTPLALLNSSIYLMQKNTDAEKRQAHAKKAEEQILRLDKLLNELLQMAYLDRSQESFEFTAMDINGLLASLVHEYESAAAAKDMTIRFMADPNPCVAQIDAVELARAITNMMENAIAYTPVGGSITLRTHTQDDHAIISMQDTGIGIAAADLPHIFEHFYRADQARSTETGGSGLGLSIAQKIVDSHNGTIEVESTPGQGSTFSIKLPLDGQSIA